MGSEYSPLQRTVIFLSFFIILASAVVSIVYLAGKNRGKEEAPPVPVPDDGQQQEEQQPQEEEPVWDGISLQKTEDAGEEYVNETLFLGDSNFLRMVGQGVLTHRNVIGKPGKGISSVRGDRDVYLAGYSEPVTAISALKVLCPRRILMNFGTNDLLGRVDYFIITYKNAIAAIQRAYSYADVIVMSIPALREDEYTGYGTLTMKTVDEYNEALKDMCRDLEIPFLNVTDECLKDPETGFARSEIMYEDGIHIEANGLTELLNYYRTHAYITEDRRPVKQGSTYVIWSPAEPDKIDCSALLSDVSVRLAANGYDMTGSSDEEGAVRYFYYTVDSAATDDEQDSYAADMVSYVNGSCSAGAKLRITWGDDGSGNHVFTIKEITTCTEHEYGEWTVTVPATCSAKGSRKRTCSKCGHEETEEIDIDPQAHSYSWETVREATCSEPGEEKGTCTACGDVTTREIIKEHEPNVTQPEVPATCTQSGYTREVICSVCGEVLEEKKEVPALGHDYASSVTKEPTETEEGVRTYTCSRCGDTYSEAIPKLEPEPTPEPEPEPTSDPESGGDQ